jgi:phosphoribosylaminoimidazole-succinocarboxamide synthase
LIAIQGIPNKGSLLTTLSLFWFDKLSKILPHHVLAPAPSTCWNEEGDRNKADEAWQSFPRSLDEYRDQLEGRSMIVRKCEVIKVEAIVRGYITGKLASRAHFEMIAHPFLHSRVRLERIQKVSDRPRDPYARRLEGIRQVPPANLHSFDQG